MWQILTKFLICTAHYICILKLTNLDNDNLVGILIVLLCFVLGCVCVSVVLAFFKV